MPRQIFTFTEPERFIVGTVGQPGERVFYLQTKQGAQVVSVALEKLQAQVLAERLDQLLDEVRRRGSEIPVVGDLEDVAPLDQPIMEEFRVGTMSLAWDEEGSVVVIEAHAQTEDGADVPDEDDAEGPDMLRVSITAAYARSFVKRAQRVVQAGRPPCPLCGLPLDPEGHICPRQNGHRH
ncbi:MAG: DUF3090 domain-containing protein [Mycobacteriales bacterium]